MRSRGKESPSASVDGTVPESDGHGNRQVLWHPEDGRFDPGRLRRAIVSRGWTVTEFAQVARIYPGTLYRALTGRPTNDGTAIRIFQTLEKRRPMDMDEL